MDAVLTRVLGWLFAIAVLLLIAGLLVLVWLWGRALKMGRMLALLLAVTLSACGCASTPVAYKGIRIRPAVLQQLADIHDEFERETAWCLTGSVKGGVVTIDDVAAPVVENRTPISATFNCGAWPNARGYFHNHPNTHMALCRPSPMDIQSLDRLRFDVLLISCDGGYFVYRYRGEAELYRIGPSMYRPSVPQSHGGK